MKRTWIKINESLGHKKEKDQIKMMNFSEKIVNDPKEIAENLCKYFSEEGSKLCHEAVKNQNINLYFKLTKLFDVSKTRDFQIATFCF